MPPRDASDRGHNCVDSKGLCENRHGRRAPVGWVVDVSGDEYERDAPARKFICKRINQLAGDANVENRRRYILAS
jgi:hypothetical protein